MSDPGRPIGEEELHAYVDDQLDPDRQPAVLRYLQEHPDAARQVAGWRAQRAALRTVFAAVATKRHGGRIVLTNAVCPLIVSSWSQSIAADTRHGRGWELSLVTRSGTSVIMSNGRNGVGGPLAL